MNWLSKLWRGKAEPSRPEADKQALVILVNHRLNPFRQGPTGVDETFVPVADFLTALEMRAAGSAMLRWDGSRPDTVKNAARISLRADVMAGKVPFFYRDNGNRTVFIEDTYVPVRYLADHAAALLAQNQVTLADVYAAALSDREADMPSFSTLKRRDNLSHIEGSDMGKVFEVGADDDNGNQPIQPVLRIRRNNGIQPS